MTSLGTVAWVDTFPANAFLAVDAAAGSTTLTVEDASSLPDAGQVEIGDAIYDFTLSDDVLVTITPSLAADMEEGTSLQLVPDGAVKLAGVVTSTGDGDAITCRVPFGVRAYRELENGPRQEGSGETVAFESDETVGGYVLVDLPDEEPSVEGSRVFGPLPNAEIPPPDLTELYEQLDALAIELEAVLPITATKITDGAIETSKLAANAVTAAKIAAEAVTAEKLFVDQAMVVKLVAKMIEVEALNAQVITGIQIVGGSISIAQGVASTLDQNFETASGTTPPTGWTRSVVTNTGSNSGGGVDFVTSGGNPGRRLRLRTSVVGSALEDMSLQSAFPTAVAGADFIVEFDYKWSGPSIGNAFPPSLGLSLRAATAGNSTPGVIRINLLNGQVRVSTGFENTEVLGGAMASDTWHRVRVSLRGATLAITRTVIGGSPLAPISMQVSSNLVGLAEFFAYTWGVFGAQSTVQTVDIDNVHLEVLRTGLSVAPDGKTAVEYLQVNQAAVVPDPILPTDAVNLRTMNSAIGTDTGWVNITLESDITPRSGFTPQVRRIGKQVFVRGSIVHNFTNQRSIGNIPDGFNFRPSQQYDYVFGFAAPAVVEGWVNTGGTINVRASSVTGSTVYVPLAATWAVG